MIGLSDLAWKWVERSLSFSFVQIYFCIVLIFFKGMLGGITGFLVFRATYFFMGIG
jgi:hypothetical protein